MSYNNPFNPLGQPGSPAVYQALISAIRQIFRWLSRNEADTQMSQMEPETTGMPKYQSDQRSEQNAVDHDPKS